MRNVMVQNLPARLQLAFKVLLVWVFPRIESALVIHLRWTPHPVRVPIRDNRDGIRVLLYSYYTTITGRGVLLRYTLRYCNDYAENPLMFGLFRRHSAEGKVEVGQRPCGTASADLHQK